MSARSVGGLSVAGFSGVPRPHPYHGSRPAKRSSHAIRTTMIRTKIVATMGPACSTAQTLYGLFEAGVDVCRLNFSHGSLDEHLVMLRNIREAAARCDQPIAVLGDLCGPKIRLGQGGRHRRHRRHADRRRRRARSSSASRSSARRAGSARIYPHFVDDVQVGHRVLIEDGMLRFVCTDKNYNELRCNCTMGGMLKSSKGINLPDTPRERPLDHRSRLGMRRLGDRK